MAYCIRLCRLNELPPGSARGFCAEHTGAGRDIFIARGRYCDNHGGGEVFGYLNRCPHTGAPLEWQPHRFLSADGRFIQCAMHDARFTINTGRCVSGPCAGQGLEPIRLEIEDGVVVWRPDTEAQAPRQKAPEQRGP